MLVLGVETATSVGSVAVVDERGLIGEYTLNVEVTHSARLLPAIDLLLRSIKIPFSNIDVLSVSLGPGSFTGLRIGISTIKGLSLAGKKPVVGIPTLDALAQNCFGFESLVCPMVDARKKEVFTALYRWTLPSGFQKLTPDLAVLPTMLLQMIEEKAAFLGDGSQLYQPLIKKILGSEAVFVPPHLNHPRAATVAFMGLEEIKRGNTVDITKLTPIYVRPSEAEFTQGQGESKNNRNCRENDLLN